MNFRRKSSIFLIILEKRLRDLGDQIGSRDFKLTGDSGLAEAAGRRWVL
jgi:hypothetical protein